MPWVKLYVRFEHLKNVPFFDNVYAALCTLRTGSYAPAIFRRCNNLTSIAGAHSATSQVPDPSRTDPWWFFIKRAGCCLKCNHCRNLRPQFMQASLPHASFFINNLPYFYTGKCWLHIVFNCHSGLVN